MKYSYSWLKELSDTKLSPEKVRELLTMHSLEIEGMEEKKWNFDGVVVGNILEIKKHPNADKLQIAVVETRLIASLHTEKLQIVCGAPNIEVGQKVPVALVGSKLPNGIEIKEAEIRGEKSFGMLCALDELGLGIDHSGIFILDSKAKIGAPAKKYLGVEDDTIFEIKVLPDRAHDAMSHVGVAREISVLENRKFEYDFDGLKLPRVKTQNFASLRVRIEDKELCSRYIGAVMENVEIKDSPSWMKQRLEASGIRPINNVVDATNYVMLELGQPMHAFDFDKIKSEFPISNFQFPNKSQNQKSKVQIVVRKAKKNEEMELLDETKLKLSENDLLITNGETPLALAGIMGGKDSGINENTKTIILEAANFNAVNIRRSRTRLGVKTESSDRFEKDIDPNLAEKAIVRIVEILEHTAGAKLEGVVDVYPNKIKSWKIKLDLNYVNNLLGENVPQKETIKILNNLGISTTIRLHIVVCEIPTYRLDIRTQEDLIEEIGRIWGYEKIEPRPLTEPVIPAKINEILSFERKLGEIAVGMGYDEMYNYSFYSEIDAKNCALDGVHPMDYVASQQPPKAVVHGVKHFELSSPMNPDQKYVRVSFVPNILKNIKTNLKNFESLNIFEIGKVYLCHPELVSGSGFRIESGMTTEKRMLVMSQVLEKDKDAETFYSLKGAVESLLEKIGVDENGGSTSIMEVEPPFPATWHLTRSAEILIDGEKIGMIGEINPIVLGKYKIGKRVAVCELDTQKLLKISQKEIVYKTLQKFPTITRDISMLAKSETKAIEIQKLIKKIGGNLVLNVEMFDVFFKDGVTSFAYHIEFGASERTLENVEVDEVMGKIVVGLEKELGLEIRK